jgi:hypothetical protein
MPFFKLFFLFSRQAGCVLHMGLMFLNDLVEVMAFVFLIRVQGSQRVLSADICNLKIVLMCLFNCCDKGELSK